jgi:hypothetical protein
VLKLPGVSSAGEFNPFHQSRNGIDPTLFMAVATKGGVTMAMGHYGVKSDLSPEEVLEKAKAYFGEAGMGLTLTEENDCCLKFEGGGGHVAIRVTNGGKTDVDLITQEWMYDVQKFMGMIG